jgi:hypothetical protein
MIRVTRNHPTSGFGSFKDRQKDTASTDKRFHIYTGDIFGDFFEYLIEELSLTTNPLE